MRAPALALTCLLLVLPSAVAVVPPIPPVNDPVVVTVVQLVPGGVPLVAAPPACAVSTAPGHAIVTCGPLWPTPPNPVLPTHGVCLWTAVAVTSLVDAVNGASVCDAGGAAFAAATATPGGPATDFDVDMTVGSLPWTCTADFAPGAVGSVVCERGVDP